jgi:hypothetical protein
MLRKVLSWKVPLQRTRPLLWSGSTSQRPLATDTDSADLAVGQDLSLAGLPNVPAGTYQYTRMQALPPM